LNLNSYELNHFFKGVFMQLLHVDSSILGANSVSRSLSAEVVALQMQRNAEMRVIYRDLAAEPLQHISGAHLAAAQPGEIGMPEWLEKDLANGQAALEEFLASDIVVIGAPMYNFTIPTQLKAWIDRLAVAGKTFKYGPKGPEGLAGGKKVIVASSRGGQYAAQTPMALLDHQETYLRGVLQFFGITDIQFIRAEGLGVSDQRSSSIAKARAAVAELV
jgi:FMN-dependent NADH-azoreductase